jgi:hypothetical protein
VIQLGIDVRPSGYTEPERREQLVEFFVEVADRLGAVYASAGLNGQAQAEAGGPQLSSIHYEVVVRGAWTGLPPVRTWLHWFGGPYVAELSDLPTVVTSGAGLLLRRGEEPAVRGSLPGPPIPARLCWQAETSWEQQGRSLTEVVNEVPAEAIPDIGSSPDRGQSRHAAVQQSPGTECADASPRLIGKDEACPGWPGGGHPQREGPAWIRAADGSLEEINDGAWMTRAEAQERADREWLAFEEV